jgi:Na+/H+-dicarboxylate symporter
MMNKIYNLAINPWVILAALVLGCGLGLQVPALALQLAFIGDVYVDLLKMIVLPFMVSAVIFSLQRLLRHGGAGAILMRACAVFGVALVAVAAVGAVSALAGDALDRSNTARTEAYGRIVGREAAANDTEVALNHPPAEASSNLADTLRASLVPTNVFAALAQGEALKALIFALLFGVAVGHVKGGLADGLSQGLEAIYQACQRLTRWLNYPLPLVLVCMSAGLLAKTGLEPLQSMLHFIVELTVGSVLVVAASVLLLWRRGGQSLRATIAWLRTPFALAVATRSSATCMPAMIEALSTGLRFPRERVELLVPLSISLLRIGPVLYYVVATLFVADLYARQLSPGDVMLVAAASVLAGCASAGMTGLVTVSLTGMVCGYLGLPFEAAFILFLAVDPVCDMLRTVVLVLGNSAAVSLICDKPDAAEPAPPEVGHAEFAAPAQAALAAMAAPRTAARQPAAQTAAEAA